MEKLRAKVSNIFSDTLMVCIALLVIPVLIAQNFFSLTPSQTMLISIVDWFIWIAFFLEFVLKLFTAEYRFKWLWQNKLDSLVSIIIIISPILEYGITTFASSPALRLFRLTRFIRFARFLRVLRLIAVATKAKQSWKKTNLKVYAAFFSVVGFGFISSFIATGFEYSSIDTTWIALFVGTFGVFYAFVISFFVFHVWGKFGAINTEISKEINSLRNTLLLSRQILSDTDDRKQFSKLMVEYVDSIINNLWGHEVEPDLIDKKFFNLVHYVGSVKVAEGSRLVILDNVIEEIRNASVAQANLVNTAREKTPVILWVLLIFLSTILVGSFIFLGFQNQLLATALITIITTVTGVVVALILDIDKPLEAGFWSVSPVPYLELKDYIVKNS